MEEFDENDAKNWVVVALNMLYKCVHKVFVEMPKREKGEDRLRFCSVVTSDHNYQRPLK